MREEHPRIGKKPAGSTEKATCFVRDVQQQEKVGKRLKGKRMKGTQQLMQWLGSSSIVMVDAIIDAMVVAMVEELRPSVRNIFCQKVLLLIVPISSFQKRSPVSGD